VKIYDARVTFTQVAEGPVEAVDSPERIVAYMQDAFSEDPTIEAFWVVCLNRKNKPLARSLVTKGTATASLVHPREVFRPVLLTGASAAVVVHNHPSGDPSPSQADIRATRQLREAAKVLQIDLLDHIVIGDKLDDPAGRGYYSFAEAGLL
jgi:DNA repair protein RadC